MANTANIYAYHNILKALKLFLFFFSSIDLNAIAEDIHTILTMTK